MKAQQDPAKAAEEFAGLLKNSKAIAEKTYDIMATFMQRNPTDSMAAGWSNLKDIAKLYQSYMEHLWADPAKLIDTQMAYWRDMMQLWQNTTLAWLGTEVNPLIAPPQGDKRFSSQEWDSLPIFAFIKQAYLLYAQSTQKLVSETQGLDPQKKRQLEFYTKQFVNAISPSNFILTNPQVLQTTLNTHGENLLQGLNNILSDIEKSHGESFSITMTDMTAFKVGENIAVTPGKVVFQNEMLQLIQYTPSTEQVYAKPLLIIPPWINKYYILDLKPENSLVKYCVDQGLTTFMISWVNPDERHKDKTFAHYMQEGALAAVEVIQQICGEEKVNVAGYCLGGTLLAGTLAYLTAKKKNVVESATYLATMIDFAEPGDLGVFTDEPQVSALEQRMSKLGYLDGGSMSTTFNMLRSNELIWSYFVQNYLLGKEPFPFDLLYWNCDNTNLPAAMHSFYLRKMYLENVFCKPNGVNLAGVSIDIRTIKTPAFFLSAQEDHIAPWRSTYAGAQLHSGQVEFVLSGSGHIAGVVNPPAKKKYAYWTNPKLAEQPDAWLAKSSEHAGSWWPHWMEWIKPYAGEKVPAREPGKGKYKAIEAAPGSYVLKVCDNGAE